MRVFVSSLKINYNITDRTVSVPLQTGVRTVFFSCCFSNFDVESRPWFLLFHLVACLLWNNYWAHSMRASKKLSPWDRLFPIVDDIKCRWKAILKSIRKANDNFFLWLLIVYQNSLLGTFFLPKKKKTKFALGQWNSPYFSQFNGTSLPNGGQRQINDKHLTRLFSSAACVSRWSFAKVVYNKKKFKIYFSTIFFFDLFFLVFLPNHSRWSALNTIFRSFFYYSQFTLNRNINGKMQHFEWMIFDLFV